MGQWDVVIVGGGPAGLTAALYCGRSKMKSLLIEKGPGGGQAATTHHIANYPGFPEGVSGRELAELMKRQVARYGVELVRDQVTGISAVGDVRRAQGLKGGYEGKTLILACGAEPKCLDMPGEREFQGRGVSYCATCDADFYNDVDVAVVGNGDSALQEALYLTRFASKVHVIAAHSEGTLHATRTLVDEALANEKMVFCWNSVIDAIEGQDGVERIRIRQIVSGETRVLEVFGVFVFAGTAPRTEFVQGLVATDEMGYIETDEYMRTNVAGVFAVGDARRKPVRQVVCATSDGAVAAIMAERYVTELKLVESLADEEVAVLVFRRAISRGGADAVRWVEQARRRLPGARVVDIDESRSPSLVFKYGIKQYPSVVVLKRGSICRRYEGEVDPEIVAGQIGVDPDETD